MNALLDQIRAYWQERSARERWLVVLGGCVIALVLVQTTVIGQIDASALRAEQEASQLEDDRIRATRLATDIRAVQGGLRAVEARIRPGEKTNLLALLERLATTVQISKDQLESIKPRQPGRNQKYPETGVDVRLRGVTLDQTTRFLHKIETSESHMIIRSLGIRSRANDKSPSPLLDVKFSVSSFEKRA
ncbi:MAG: hypothetical protein GY725_24590 [bacterium]|nr:hypothetical protein [bacterium]